MKALVLVSGGLDSATCLALAVEKFGADNCFALSVSYGQKHQKERTAAKALADYYRVPLRELDLRSIFEGSDCSLLEWSKEKIPHESYESQLNKEDTAPVSTYVPFRNGLFLSCAASIALSHDCDVIYYGIHSDDAAGNAYPDTSDDFHQSMSRAILVGSGEQVKMEAPFVHQNKAEVVKTGIRLKVPYELTWSCYEGHEKACGVCATCIDRRQAFLKNGRIDPIAYEEEI